MNLHQIFKSILYIFFVSLSMYAEAKEDASSSSPSSISNHERCVYYRKQYEEYNIELKNTRDTNRLEFLPREIKRVKEEMDYFCD